MKIAVAAMGNTVAGHFGHCENFIFFDTADGAITAVNSVPNPGHRPGFLPNFLADNGAQVIISGGMGGAGGSSFGTLITIQQMIVRSEDDIRRISQELYNLIQTGSRAQGRFSTA